KRQTACFAAPCPKRAVEAVFFTGRCDHCFEDGFLAFWGRQVGVTFCQVGGLITRRPFLLRQWRIPGRLKQCHIPHLSEFLKSIRLPLDIHPYMILNKCSIVKWLYSRL